MFEWLSERIEQAHKVFQEFSLDWTFILNSPATEAEIQACEVDLGVALPPSYREFLLRWNGAYLFCVEEDILPPGWENSGLVIHGTATLLGFNQPEWEGFTAEEWNSLVAFCYLGRVRSGDFCALDPQQTTNSEYTVLDCFHELTPAEWRQARIAFSFAGWLERLFNQVVDEKKLPEYWFEAESSSAFSLAEETPYALLRQGRKKADKGDHQGAIADFNQVLLLDPKDSYAYYERGNVLFALGDYQKASEDYTQAIGFTPQNVIFYNKRGLARIELKDYQGAIEDFNQALQVNSKYAETYNNRGNARFQLGDRQGAMKDYQKAAKILANQQKMANQEVVYEQVVSTTLLVYGNDGTTVVLEDFCEDD